MRVLRKPSFACLLGGKIRTVSYSAVIGLVLNKLLSRVGAITLIAAVVSGMSADAWAERRIALVVGNSNYKIGGISLATPRNDAQDISTALTTLGFDVVTTIDATKRDMGLALARFARLAIDADAALFFYSGHAIQYQGSNYLMPTDAELEDEISTRYQTVDLEEVLAALDRTSGVKIMILDASRYNPVADRPQKPLAGPLPPVRRYGGLAEIAKTGNMVVASAAASDEIAQEGRGRNSPFTAALLRRIQEPGLEIAVMFRRV